jgi:hypothetical protein
VVIVAIAGLVALLAGRRVLAAGGVLLDEPEDFLVNTRDSGIERVDWSAVKFFRPAEFGDRADDIDPRTIYAADAMRARLGSPLTVSPVLGATARFGGNARSQHYAIGRRATAVDLMPAMATLGDAYRAALGVQAIGGVGLYPDTSPLPMIHIDTRPRKPGGGVFQWQGHRASPDEPWQYASIDTRVIA